APDARNRPGRRPCTGGPRLRLSMEPGHLPRLPARELLVLDPAARRTADRLFPVFGRGRRGARAQHLRRPETAGAGPRPNDDGSAAEAGPPAPRGADLPGGAAEQSGRDPPVRVAGVQRDRPPAALLPVARRTRGCARHGNGAVLRLTRPRVRGDDVTPSARAGRRALRAGCSSPPAACVPAPPPRP